MWQDAKEIITRKMRAIAGYTPARILRVGFTLCSSIFIYNKCICCNGQDAKEIITRKMRAIAESKRFHSNKSIASLRSNVFATPMVIGLKNLIPL